MPLFSRSHDVCLAAMQAAFAGGAPADAGSGNIDVRYRPGEEAEETEEKGETEETETETETSAGLAAGLAVGPVGGVGGVFLLSPSTGRGLRGRPG